MDKEEIAQQLNQAAEKIRQLKVPDEITTETKEDFRTLLRALDSIYEQILRLNRTMNPRTRRRGKRISAGTRLESLVNSRGDDSFFQAQVYAGTIIQGASYDYVEPSVVRYLARTITSLGRTLSAVAERLEEIAILVVEGGDLDRFFGEIDSIRSAIEKNRTEMRRLRGQDKKR